MGLASFLKLVGQLGDLVGETGKILVRAALAAADDGREAVERGEQPLVDGVRLDTGLLLDGTRHGLERDLIGDGVELGAAVGRIGAELQVDLQM